MNLRRIIKEEIDEFGWIREINPSPFKSFSVGDTVMVTDVTDYLIDALDYCGEEENYISTGIEYTISNIDKLVRGACDCGLSENEVDKYDPEEVMLSMYLVNHDVSFWVNEDMVTLQKLGRVNESEDFDWIKQSEFQNDYEKLKQYISDTPLTLEPFDYNNNEDSLPQAIDFIERVPKDGILGSGWLEVYFDKSGKVTSKNRFSWKNTVDRIKDYQEGDIIPYVIEIYRIIFDSLTKLFPNNYSMVDKFNF